jgi:hypothetical protein
MSRGKKRTKAEKRHRRARTRSAAPVEDQASREHEVAEMAGDLSCGFAAADELAATCGYRCSAAEVDNDLVVAAQLLWARAAGEVHPLTAALRDLRAELERHRDVMLAFQDRFDALMHQPPHDHVQPEADDLHRIRLALLGPDKAGIESRPAA